MTPSFWIAADAIHYLNFVGLQRSLFIRKSQRKPNQHRTVSKKTTPTKGFPSFHGDSLSNAIDDKGTNQLGEIS
jgi:hypothetical protein